METEDMALAFLDDEGPSNDLPAFISTTNARELYGLREGETVAEAIARHEAEELDTNKSKSRK